MNEDASPGASSQGPAELESLLASFLARRSLGDGNALDDLCARHPEHAESLRRRVARIAELGLGTLDRAPTTEETVGTSPPAERLARLREQSRSASARYEILDEVGRGGMGIVLRVRDLGLGRGLAMKVVLGDTAEERAADGVDSDVLQRFLDEAQVTGQLDHPGVVPVHELGIDDTGRPFFTMRLVRGETADRVFAMARAGEGGWTETRALEVILKVCDTMAFAHRKGVLHRDLKPANVMVGRFGEVYVMDWGLAKVRGQPDHRDLRIRPESTLSRVQTDRSEAEADSDSPLLTMDGAVVGTPSYMAPEQAEGRIEVLDERADVYAVGAMLYQLLTGWQPYVRPGARVSPYAVLAAVHAGPPAAVHALRKDVPAELAAICERAMARDLTRRYASMRELSDDLRAYLEKRVVKAYRTGPVAEMAMWVRRNRALAGALAAAAVALVGGIVATALFAHRASRVAAEQRQQLVQASWGAFHQAERLFAQADATESAAAGVAAAREGLLHLAQAVSFDATNRVAWQRFAHEASHRKASWRLPIEVAVFAHEDFVRSATFSLDGMRVLAASHDGTAKLWDVGNGKVLQTFAHGGNVHTATPSPDGTRVLTASDDEAAKLWDVGNGKVLQTFSHVTDVQTASFNSDGTRVLTASGKGVRLWDADSGTLVHAFEHESFVPSAEFSPDGTRVLTASHDETAKLWDARTGRLLSTFVHDSQVLSATFNADGSLVVTAIYDNTARLWEASSATLVRTFPHDGTVRMATFSPDGTRVLTASLDKTAKLWELASGEPVRTFVEDDSVNSATFSRDGTRVVTCVDSTARVWDVASGDLVQTLAHGSWVVSAAFGPDGTCVLTASLDKTAKLWDLGGGTVAQTFQHDGTVVQAEFSPEGTRLVTVSRDKTAKLWDATSGKVVHTFTHENMLRVATLSGDGRRLVTAGLDKVANLWDAASGSLVHTLPHEREIMSASFNPDGSRVVTASFDWTAKLWDTGSGRLVHTFQHQNGVLFASFDADGKRVVTTSCDETAKLWDAGSGNLIHTFAHKGWVMSAAFNPDGTRVVTSSDRTAKLWDAGSGEMGRTFTHDLQVMSAMFSTDGTRLVTTSSDKTAKLWDVGSGSLVHTFAHEGYVPMGGWHSAAWSADATLLLTASADGTAKLWDAGSGKLLHDFGREGGATSAAFSLDGTRAVTVGNDGAARLWNMAHVQAMSVAAGTDHVAQATALAETLTGRSLSPQGELTRYPGERRADELRATWQALLAADAPFGPLVRWLAAHGPESQAHPGSSMTCRERAGILIDNGGAIGTREALHLDPGHPLVHIALAAHESVREDLRRDRPAMEAATATRREFLRDYGLRRLPADAAVCARAAAMLLAQGDKPRALQAAHKALALEPANAEARRVASEAGR